MASAIEIAACILNECESLSTMKLQKLVYYSQAYHLARCRKPLFEEDFEAWANGPVERKLFEKHKGRFVIFEGELGEGSLANLDNESASSVAHVIDILGDYDGSTLSNLTHSERPWIEARSGCKPAERCSTVIPKESILSFYSSPEAANNPVFAA